MKPHSRSLAPRQIWETNQKRTPTQHQRTTRVDEASVITSSMGGKFVPLKMIPLLREDRLRQSSFTLNVDMAPTASMLLNPVRVSVAAYLVPKLAFERFKDMGSINRSYNGQPEVDGQVIPWFQPLPAHDSASPTELIKTLGLHVRNGVAYNSDYIEAYNAVWNYIASDRSPSIPHRVYSDQTLAPAFWSHTQMKYVKPTFDDAMIQGEIALAVNNTKMPVKGIGVYANSTAIGSAVRESDGTSPTYAKGWQGNTSQALYVNEDPDNPTFPDIYAELQSAGVTVSLANIALARETAAWARARTAYQGMSEEWMMDQLLSGIRLHDEILTQPILLDSKETMVGMVERYATDGASLEQSLAQGQTQVQLSFGTPQIECGGVVVIVAQALPEMIYERQRDYYLYAMQRSEIPDRTSDELDPQPVVMVKNAEVDEAHSLGDDLFGYAPLNHQWQRQAPNVGGKYYRADPADQWNENRNRLWTPEKADPTLGPDFYMSSTLSHEVFQSSNSDVFEWWLAGTGVIDGLTYFGPEIREATDDYDKVLDQVDLKRLKGDGTDLPNLDI